MSHVAARGIWVTPASRLSFFLGLSDEVQWGELMDGRFRAGLNGNSDSTGVDGCCRDAGCLSRFFFLFPCSVLEFSGLLGISRAEEDVTLLTAYGYASVVPVFFLGLLLLRNRVSLPRGQTRPVTKGHV